MNSSKNLPLTHAHNLIRNENQIFNIIDEEVIILSVDDGEYYGLDKVGSDIWNYLDKACSVEVIIKKLIRDYNVSKEICEKDTMPFLENLIKKDIIRIL